MNNRPVAIVSIKLGVAISERLNARVEAVTRNAKSGKETAWTLHVGKSGLVGAFRWTDGASYPREEHIERVPGNLADMALTLATA